MQVDPPALERMTGVLVDPMAHRSVAIFDLVAVSVAASPTAVRRAIYSAPNLFFVSAAKSVPVAQRVRPLSANVLARAPDLTLNVNGKPS